MNVFRYEVLVLGMGNTLMSDDGVGLYVLGILRQKHWPPGVGLVEAGVSILYYCEELSCSRSVIVVDAVRAGGPPASIYRLTAEDLTYHPEGWRDAHDFSLRHAIEMARMLTGYPVEVVVFGIEPAVLTVGSNLSRAVKLVLPQVVEAMEKEIIRLSAAYNRGLVDQSV